MAAKLLHSLTDENPDLQKQIGCMTGLLHMFDRQHLLTDVTKAHRRAVGFSPRSRLPPGSSYRNDCTPENKSNYEHLKSASQEKYVHKNVQERQRGSMESSRASFSSSSRSSSFSSPECNRASAQLEQSSFDKMIFSETPWRDTTASLQHPSPYFTHSSIDLRDFVKDSMYREIQGPSAKAKPVNSKISDDNRWSGLEQKEQTPPDLKVSLRAHAKIQEVSTHCKEPKELFRSSSCHFKDGSSFAASRDIPPRFSYDGRDMINRTPFDSGDVSKSSIKFNELPRLSLDSRDSKQILGNQARPPSVVAKLMGLEMLPDSVPCDDSCSGSRRISPDEELVNISSSLEKTEQIKSKSLWKEPTSPRWKSPDGSMKPMARFPIEPAPWKQIDGSKGSQKPVIKNRKYLAKSSTAFPSVYSEIEKRLKDLEFNQSGKDLRALKQILEAMQAKGLLETLKGQDSNFASPEDEDQVLLGSTKLVDNQRLKVTSSQNQESPIVIMKPVKHVEKFVTTAGSKVSLHGSGRMTQDQIFKSSEQTNGLNPVIKTDEKPVKTAQSAMRSQQLGREANGKSSGSITPRIQQKKAVEKRSRDSGRLTRHLNKQLGDPNSPVGRRRTKHQNHQKSDDEMSHETSIQSRHLTPQENKVLDLSTIRGSKSRVNCSMRSPVLNSVRSPSSVKASEFRLSVSKSTPMINEDRLAESSFVPVEYSSPVSVLENALCKQDSLSPSKYAGKTLKVEASSGNESNSIAVSVDTFAPISTESGAAFEINRKKLQNIDHLVQKLQRLNSTHDEARTDYIASLCENTSPDHRYISEILLASGFLLRDLTDFQFHPSGHPINPELFSVLEQTKISKCSTGPRAQSTVGKVHRKLTFDVCNEILARRLASRGLHSEPWIRAVKVARKTSNGQKLLRELCHEIDGLGAKNSKCYEDDHEDDNDSWKDILCEDLMRRSDDWMEFGGEEPGAVLDIERLIFKDLVNEIVIGESAGVVGKPRSKACGK